MGSLEKLCIALERRQLRASVGGSIARPGRPRGKKLTAEKVCKAVGRLLPDNAIIIDEAHHLWTDAAQVYSRRAAPRSLHADRRRHRSRRCRTRSARRSLAPTARCSLWSATAARCTRSRRCGRWRAKSSTSTAIIFNNASYSVLNVELERVGAEKAGPKAKAQLDLHGPVLDFSRLAEGMGVDAARCTTPDMFVRALERALAEPGPHLIEAIVPPALTGLKLKLLPRLLDALDRMPRPIARMLKRKLAP